MICPVCSIHFHVSWQRDGVPYFIMWVGDPQMPHFVVGTKCPQCKTDIVVYIPRDTKQGLADLPADHPYTVLLPSHAAKTLRPEVPVEYKDDYKEADQVLEISPKASAALSRRLLQRFIHEEVQIVDKDLLQEIQRYVSSGQLPISIAEDLDTVRKVGNWAAHPNPNLHTAEIIDVEPGEAEYLIGIIERVLEWHFVEKARRSQMHAQIALKSQQHPKPPKN